MSSAEGMVGTIVGADSIAPWDECGRECDECADDDEQTDAEREWEWCICGRKSSGREEGIMCTAPLTEVMALEVVGVSRK